MLAQQPCPDAAWSTQAQAELEASLVQTSQHRRDCSKEKKLNKDSRNVGHRKTIMVIPNGVKRLSLSEGTGQTVERGWTRDELTMKMKANARLVPSL